MNTNTEALRAQFEKYVTRLRSSPVRHKKERMK